VAGARMEMRIGIRMSLLQMRGIIGMGKKANCKSRYKSFWKNIRGSGQRA
jgi:hypothetical protein